MYTVSYAASYTAEAETIRADSVDHAIQLFAAVRKPSELENHDGVWHYAGHKLTIQ